MAFNEKLLKRVERAVIKTPRTAGEIGVRVGYKDGRGIARVLPVLVRRRRIKRVKGRPTKYVRQ